MIYRHQPTTTTYPVIHDSYPTQSEKQLIHIWKNVPQGAVYKCVDGKPILVIHPGDENHYDGPDFLNATLYMDGVVRKGNVEIHLDEYDWKRHKHHLNPIYQTVILHVVVKRSLQPSTGIPTIIIDSNSNLKDESFCRLIPTTSLPGIEQTLIRLGTKRWDRNVKQFYDGRDTSLELLLEKSLYILGKNGNESALSAYSEMVISQLHQGVSPQSILTYLDDFCLGVTWNTKGIRPARHPKSIIPKIHQIIEYILMQYHELLNGTISYKDICDQLILIGFGKGIITELQGNVFLPFLCGKAMLNSEYHQVVEYHAKWLQLQLPYTYGKIQRAFGPYIKNKSLKSFPVIQGILELETTFCSNKFCLLCPLIQDK